jgi:tRNA (guanine-N7-)-methyltransferase
MSFGLGRGRQLDDAPGVIGVSRDELPPMPDEAIADPTLARVDPRRWFNDPARPLEIEIGSGKGSFLLGHAAANPGTNLLGIEWAREFYLYAADRLRRRGLPNVRMLHADATEFIRWRCPDSLATVIHLYYSDPWPKARHHKNRVIQDRFLADARRVLTPGGELRVVTDHPDLWDWCEAHFARAAAAGGWERRAFVAPEWTDDDQVVGTNYERKTRAAGREPRACVMVRVQAPRPGNYDSP